MILKFHYGGSLDNVVLKIWFDNDQISLRITNLIGKGTLEWMKSALETLGWRQDTYSPIVE